jgi:uncharacterized lipoprotein YmbA
MMMLKTWSAWLVPVLFVMAGLLSGCSLRGNTPPSTFYMLEATSTTPTVVGLENITIGVGPMVVVEYLDRPQIVTRTNGVEVVVDQFHRWAGPVREAIIEVTVGEIAAQTGSDWIFSSPWPSSTRLDYQLMGNVGRFDTTESGLARMEVQWGLYIDRQPVHNSRSVYEAQAKGLDYAARVTALNEVLRQFASDVVTTVAERPADKP